MKRLLVLMLCVVLVCAMPIVAFAEDVAEDVTVEETDTPTTEKSEEQIEAELMTDKIIGYIQSRFEEISVILTLILTLFYQVKKHASLNKSIGTLNNNAVAVAENSSSAINKALSGIGGVSSAVTEYIGKMDDLLMEVRMNEEDKKKMQAALDTAMKYVESAKEANVEFANELAELLCLANIPNSKKEELYARHRAAVDAIKALGNTEVKENEATEE